MLLFIPDWVYVEKKSRKCVKEISRKCYQGNFQKFWNQIIFDSRDSKLNWRKSLSIQFQKLRHTRKAKKICLNGSRSLGAQMDQYMKMEFSNLNYHSPSNTPSNHQIASSRHEFIIAISILRGMFALIFYR